MSKPERKLIGFFSADTSSREIAKAIIASRPPKTRSVEDHADRSVPPEDEPKPE